MDEAPPINKRRRYIVLSIVLAALFLVGGKKLFGSLADLKEESEKKSGARLPELVRTRTASAADHTETVVAYGRARPTQITTVASELAARVEWVEPTLEAGVRLEAPPAPATGKPQPGQVLMRLDGADFDDQIKRIDEDLKVFDRQLEQLTSARQSLAEQLRLAVAERETAQRELDRIAGLVASRKLTPNEEDRQRLAVQARDRIVLQLRAGLTDNDASRPVLKARRSARALDKALIERNQARTLIRLPHPGIVVERLVAPGDRVAPGAPLIRILDGRRVEVVLQLPARLHGVVTTSTAVRLRDADSGEQLPDGVIARIAPAIDERQRVFEVYVKVPGSATQPGVAPGTTVRADVDARVTKNVIAIPREAFMGESLYIVAPYEVEGDSEEVRAALAKGERFVKAQRRTPKIKRWLLDVALIESGVEAGDEYVTSNLEAVAKDSRLRIASANEASAEDAEDGAQ